MAKKNGLAIAMAICMLIGAISPIAAAKKDDNTPGQGQEEIHIHHVGGITENKGRVTLTFEDGSTMTGHPERQHPHF